LLLQRAALATVGKARVQYALYSIIIKGLLKGLFASNHLDVNFRSL
jgi:hypothetical protein